MRIKEYKIINRIFEINKIKSDYCFDFSFDLFLILDLRGNIVYANSNYLGTLGYSQDIDLPKKSIELIDELVHHEDKDATILSHQDAITGKKVIEFENRYRCIDGTYKYYSWTSFPLIKKGFIYMIARDITEKKEIEEQLRKSNQMVNSILGRITDGFYAFDKKWLFTYVNKEAEQMTGKKKEEIIGKYALDVFPKWHNSKVWEQYNKAVKENIPIHFETQGIYAGRDKWLEIHAYPSHDGLSVYFRDITEYKNYLKEMEHLSRLDLIAQMAAGISHEIRNPMTSIRGFMQMLSGKEECGKYKRYFEMMIEELDSCNNIIKEFLALTQNKPENLEMRNLNEIIGKIYPLILADVIKNNMNISLKQKDIPSLLVNEKEIRQLILNLVRNGIDAMSAGGLLTIRTYKEENKIVLSIEDQGAGISYDLVEKIGTPFFTTKAEGTGLGLASCYSIATRNNASIDFSTSSLGTTFFVRFNLATTAEQI